MNTSDLFIKCLENEGVKFIFGMAGEENLHLLEAIRKSSIMYVPVRHEQAAGFMAATYGRLTGKMGVALSTLGPGATNLVTAVAYAKLGAMPSLFITGQKPLKDNLQGDFQIIDVVRMMEPLVKKSTSINIPIKVPSTIRKLTKLAQEERPGPVHIEIPKDVSLEEVDHLPIEQDFHTRRPLAEYKAIENAVEMIKAANMPLILVGASANRKSTSKMLTELINETGIAFVDTQMGKGVIDETHPKFIGTTTLTKGDPVHEAIELADLIINVGHDTIEKTPFLMNHKSDKKVIHINYFSADVHQYYFPQLEVIGDIANAVWQIKEKLKTYNYKCEKCVAFDGIIENMQSKVYLKSTNWDENTKTLPAINMVDVVMKQMQNNGIVCLDNGMYKLWFSRYYKARYQNSLLLDNALATMGAGLPSGIATKLINQDKKVLVVAGDGGFMMNSQEIETAVRLKLDLVILILNDSGLGMIRWEQAEKNYDSFGLSHNNPDFVKYAESYGAKGHKVNTPSELSRILELSFAEGGIHLIDAKIDYSLNESEFSTHKN